MKRALVSLVALGAIACGDRPRATAPTAIAPWGTSTSKAKNADGARYAFLPSSPATLKASLDLGGGKTLLVGSHGERWVREGQAEANAAGDLAAEDLIAVAERPGGAFVFVGAHGALLEADGPLAPFSRAIVPPETARSADARGSTLAVVTTRGSLLVSTDGGDTFTRAQLGDGRVADVALVDEEHGFALELPEKLWATSDGGRTFTKVNDATVGASAFGRGPGDLLRILGLFRAPTLHGTERPIGRRLGPAPAIEGITLGVDLPAAPSANAIIEHRATIADGTVWDLVAPAKKGEPSGLLTAAVGSRFTNLPVTLPDEGCHTLVVASSLRGPVIACALAGDDEGLAIFRKGADGAFARTTSFPAEVHAGELAVATSLEGSALVVGVCRKNEQHHCEADAVTLLPKADGATADDLVAVSAPALAARPVAIAFGTRGNAYLIGRRTKSDTNELALFVSHDGGKSFAPRALPGFNIDLKKTGPSDSRVSRVELTAQADGLVSVGIESDFGASFDTFDEDGRSIAQSIVGSSNARVGTAGSRAFFVDGAATWESLDGGATVVDTGVVSSLLCPPRSGNCVHPVACDAAGCLVGSEVARVGWGLAPKSPELHDSAPEGRTRPPKVLPPIVCRLDKGKWSILPHGARRPETGDADRGKMAWSVVGEDKLHGGVFMGHGLANGTVESVQLLAPSTTIGTIAQDATSQDEGGAAARITWRKGANGDGAWNQPASIEVAWENLFDGKRGHATLTDLGNLLPGDVRIDSSALVAKLVPDLLSVSQGGLFVRLRDDGPLAFVDFRGSVEKMAVTGPPPLITSTDFVPRFEAVRIGSSSIPLALLPDASMARFAAGRWDAFRIDIANQGDGDRMDFAYVGTEPQLLYESIHDGAPRTELFPFRASGSVVGDRLIGPNAFTAVAKFRVCTPQDRAKTARVPVSGMPGVRRAVLVEAADGSVVAGLASEGMVLYGTAESPCISVIQANAVPEEGTSIVGTEQALVFPGDMEHGWLFRIGVSESQDVEARTMKCHVDANADVPTNVAAIVGE